MKKYLIMIGYVILALAISAVLFIFGMAISHIINELITLY